MGSSVGSDHAEGDRALVSNAVSIALSVDLLDPDGYRAPHLQWETTLVQSGDDFAVECSVMLGEWGNCFQTCWAMPLLMGRVIVR